MPKVSVVVPVYNCGEFLSDLVESMKTQTLSDFEVIFIDDGSKDNSAEVINKHLPEDSRFRYIYQENQGGGIARNTGISNANAEYVICIDADDLYEKDMLEVLYNRAKETDADITICKFKRWDMLTGRIANGKGIEDKLLPDKEVFSADDFENILEFTNPGPCNKLYKLDFIRKNNLFYSGTKIINDLKFGMVALCIANKIAVVDKALSTYRYQGSASNSKNREKKLECSVRVFKEIYEEFCNRNIYEKNENLYISKIFDSIKYEMSFPVSDEVIALLKNFLSNAPFDKMTKKDKEKLFKLKRVKKQNFEYTLLNILTFSLNKSIKYKYTNHKNAIKNLQKLINV